MLSDVAYGLSGVELEHLSGPYDLGDSFGQCLAFLAGELISQLVASGEQLGAGAIEDLAARGPRSGCPFRRCVGGRRDGRPGQLRIRDCETADRVGGVGRVDVGSGLGLRPATGRR